MPHLVLKVHTHTEVNIQAAAAGPRGPAAGEGHANTWAQPAHASTWAMPTHGRSARVRVAHESTAEQTARGGVMCIRISQGGGSIDICEWYCLVSRHTREWEAVSTSRAAARLRANTAGGGAAGGAARWRSLSIAGLRRQVTPPGYAAGLRRRYTAGAAARRPHRGGHASAGASRP